MTIKMPFVTMKIANSNHNGFQLRQQLYTSPPSVTHSVTGQSLELAQLQGLRACFLLQISATSVLADGKKTGDCLTDTFSVSNPGGNSPPGDKEDNGKGKDKEDKGNYKTSTQTKSSDCFADTPFPILKVLGGDCHHDDNHDYHHHHHHYHWIVKSVRKASLNIARDCFNSKMKSL